MQVQKVQNNYNNQNFTARNNIRLDGQFRKHRNLAHKVIDELNQSETYKKFSDNYQTKIILDRYLCAGGGDRTLLWINYKSKLTESGNKFVNFLKKVVQPLKPNKSLVISFYDSTIIEHSTDRLIKEIKSGKLDEQINSVYKRAK